MWTRQPYIAPHWIKTNYGFWCEPHPAKQTSFPHCNTNTLDEITLNTFEHGARWNEDSCYTASPMAIWFGKSWHAICAMHGAITEIHSVNNIHGQQKPHTLVFFMYRVWPSLLSTSWAIPFTFSSCDAPEHAQPYKMNRMNNTQFCKGRYKISIALRNNLS